MASPKRRFNHVAVLLGGWSADREVSLRSGKACADALESAGYKVTRVDASRDLAKEIEWGPTINLNKGTCYWINPLILAAPRSG